MFAAFVRNSTKVAMATKETLDEEHLQLPTNNNIPNSTSSVAHHHQFQKPKVFNKRARKCHASSKRSGDHSIAPLLETISALAVNSDASDDSEYENYQGSGGMHDEDEDDVEDYDFEQNESEEQKQLCSENNTNKSFDNVQSKYHSFNFSFVYIIFLKILQVIILSRVHQMISNS